MVQYQGLDNHGRDGGCKRRFVSRVAVAVAGIPSKTGGVRGWRVRARVYKMFCMRTTQPPQAHAQHTFALLLGFICDMTQGASLVNFAESLGTKSCLAKIVRTANPVHLTLQTWGPKIYRI